MNKEELITRFYSGIPIILLIAAAIIFWGYKMTKPANPPRITVNQSLPSRFWVILTCSVILLCYLLYGYVVSLAWLRIDEISIFAVTGQLGFSERVAEGWGRYIHWVSRAGELLMYAVGLSQNRWEMWITIVPAIALTPLAMWAVVRPSRFSSNPENTLFSLRGIVFYVAVFSLCLIASDTSEWRTQACYAAGCNYAMLHAVFIYIMSYFRTDQVNVRNSFWACIGAFLLGLLAGWSTEAITVIMVPLLLTYTAYMAWKHRHILPLRTYCALAGMVCGAYMLFSSPALTLRSEQTRSSVSAFVNSMSPEQLQSWLNNLTDADVLKLQGSGSIISLSDIPLFDHVYFIPFASERMWECCQYGMIAFIILVVLYAVTKRQGIAKTLILSLGFVALGWLCSYSYLASCIPTKMSYTPACYMIVIACAFLIWRLKYIVDASGVAVAVSGLTTILIMPSAVEAYHYKKFDKERFKYIERQAAAGVQHIVLKNVVPKKPKDEMRLLRVNDITNDPKYYRNSSLKSLYRVKSIRQEPVK